MAGRAATARRVSALPDDAFDQDAASVEHRRDARRADTARNRQYRQATELGAEHRRRRDRDPEAFAHDPELRAEYERSARDAAAQHRRETVSGLFASTPVVRTRSVAQDTAGVVVGVLTYALFLAYVRGVTSGIGGPAGVRQWLAAKFLNKTPKDKLSAPAPAQPATPGRPAGPTAAPPAPFLFPPAVAMPTVPATPVSPG